MQWAIQALGNSFCGSHATTTAALTKRLHLLQEQSLHRNFLALPTPSVWIVP